MSNLVERVRRFGRRRDDGATAVEYGLLIALIAIVMAVGALVLGNALSTRLNDAGTCVQNANSTDDCNP